MTVLARGSTGNGTMELTRSEASTPTPITVLRLAGTVCVEKLRASATHVFSEAPTPLVLWDWTEADLGQLALSDLYGCLAAVKTQADARRGRKSAILVGSGLGYGVVRWLRARAETTDVPFQIEPFTDWDEALAWLAGG